MNTLSEAMLDALKLAGTPEREAKKAAKEIGQLYFEHIKTQSEVKINRWMISFDIMLSMAVIGLLFK